MDDLEYKREMLKNSKKMVALLENMNGVLDEILSASSFFPNAQSYINTSKRDTSVFCNVIRLREKFEEESRIRNNGYGNKP